MRFIVVCSWEQYLWGAREAGWADGEFELWCSCSGGHSQSYGQLELGRPFGAILSWGRGLSFVPLYLVVIRHLLPLGRSLASSEAAPFNRARAQRGKQLWAVSIQCCWKQWALWTEGKTFSCWVNSTHQHLLQVNLYTLHVLLPTFYFCAICIHPQIVALRSCPDSCIYSEYILQVAHL